ncbi:hypothetical protein POM88_021577 [Heracleum sosnowskyi]|uniref:Uncharacterized protein n=1 Tax=Heracleum sosnowskyi TaxID=360622 RepID=A0AAD8IDG1_9APIA|nr:hypothetical protein POM88_021577 [Heracleum sosnowskyi]
MENSRQYSFFDYEYHSNIFQTQNTNAGTSQTNEVRANFDVNFHQSQERQIEDIINEGVRRSNAIYNLSEADDIIQEVVDSPYIKVSNIMNQIRAIYKYQVTYKKAWLGKQKAIAEIYGDWTTSYSKLPKFLSALMHFNPGTSALIEAEADVTTFNTSVCKRVWWAFKPMADGWKYALSVMVRQQQI